MNNSAGPQKKYFLTYELVKTVDDKDLYKVLLSNGEVSIELTNVGCSIVSIQTPGKNGILNNIVAGFDSVDDYLVNRDYMGCVVGRYANRIAKGQFNLDGKNFQLPVNNDDNHLHGGLEGFSKKVWEIQNFIQSENGVGVQLKYFSADGEEGYPGNLQVSVTYILNEKNQLVIVYEAETDKATPVNFTNHSYFNLTGFDRDTIDQHLLLVNAKSFTEKSASNVPTGKILPVEGTPLDFSGLEKIGKGLKKFPRDLGYDHNFVLEKNTGEDIGLAAKLFEPANGRTVTVYTTQPGIQVYTANYFDGTIKGSQGKFYQQHAAVALETQSFPDSPNHPEFPGTILRPGQHYLSKTIYEFTVE